MTMLTVRRNMSKSTIKAPPTRASIDGMFGYSTVILDDIFDFLPPALLRVAERGNTLVETILIRRQFSRLCSKLPTVTVMGRLRCTYSRHDQDDAYVCLWTSHISE